MEAIYDSELESECRFKVTSVHDIHPMNKQYRGSWRVILTPLGERIYFLGRIIWLVSILTIDVSTVTDSAYPGCIIFE